MDWDDAYSNAAYIQGGADYPMQWSARASKFRNDHPLNIMLHLDLRYGPEERQVFDLFEPGSACKGLCVFVHGGYWMRFSKNDWSHLAAGALARSWAVALPSYRLCPDVRISEIAGDVAAAITKAATMVKGPIRLAGHSAGGHLVTRMVCDGTQLSATILDRINAVTSISGLHDLRPLMNTSMNATLRITADEARQESPAMREPKSPTRITCWVGSDERPEFIRQNDLLVAAWGERGASISGHQASGRHHFNVIDDLCDPESHLCRLFAA
jgi:acetyl esterase/lipase